MPVVYMATNLVNGKRYIGATKHTVNHRRKKHFADSRASRPGCRVFNAAIRKYGECAFKWEELITCKSVDDAMVEEAKFIKKLKPEYNITAGGRGLIGIPRTKEWLERMSASLKGKKMSPARRAENTEHMRRLSVKRYKPVVCLVDGRFFISCKEAAEFYGVTHNNIRSVASGGQATTKGLSFAFSNQPLSKDECLQKIQQLEERKQSNIKRQRSSKNQRVICLADGIEYENASSAASVYGVTTSRVRQLCHLGGATLSGIGFALVDRGPVQKKELTPEQRADGVARRNAALKRGLLKTSKRVICLDDNTVYDSISDAARAIGRCVESVSASIHRQGKTGGKSFRFLET